MMLIDTILDFCDKKYTTYGNRCGCGQCNHPSGTCSGSCYNCLYQIHYPSQIKVKANNQKLIYDCPKMIYHYVCQYTCRYTSELLYAYDKASKILSGFDKYNVMSLGCGSCPDLMALEQYESKNQVDIPIGYKGYDINPLWSSIVNAGV